MKRKIAVGLAVIMVIGLATPAISQDTDTIDYSWTSPTSGSPVITYRVELQRDGGDWNTVGVTLDTTYTLTYLVGETVAIRVAGQDARGRYGEVSVSSDAYTDLGPPGAPGKPELVMRLVMGLVFVMLAFLAGRRVRRV